MNSFKISALAAIVAASVFQIKAETGNFTYATDGALVSAIGTNKAETYNVAIRLDDPSFVGAKITKASVMVPNGVVDPKFFITTTLSQETVSGKRQNVADVCTVDAVYTPGEGEWGEISVEFADSYTITTPEVYVGYTFTVADAGSDTMKRPVTGTAGSDEDGLYMMSSRTYMKWKSYAAQTNLVSGLQVSLEGNFKAACMAISVPQSIDIMVNDNPMTVAATITNHGATAIRNIDYVLKVGDKEYAGVKEFRIARNIQFGRSMDVSLSIDHDLAKGEYPAQFTITKVNGEDNVDICSSDSTMLFVLEKLPVNRPLLEEYSGLWCGWCPRGYVAMETLAEEFKGLFVGVCYHSGDDMQISGEFPSNTDVGFPLAYLNRTLMMDPFYGLASSGFGARTEWMVAQSQFTPWDIEVSASWNDDLTEISVKSSVSVVKSVKGDYKVAYMLLADSLTSASWRQNNNYSSDRDTFWDNYPVMQLFIKGGSRVSGLLFNDVIVGRSATHGEAGSLPETMTANNVVEGSYTFKAEEIVNYRDKPLIQDPSKLKVVAVVIDGATGGAMNSNVAQVAMPESGVTDVVADAQPVTSVYYDLSGRKVNAVTTGIYIRQDLYADGLTKSQRVFVR